MPKDEKWEEHSMSNFLRDTDRDRGDRADDTEEHLLQEDPYQDLDIDHGDTEEVEKLLES